MEQFTVCTRTRTRILASDSRISRLFFCSSALTICNRSITIYSCTRSDRFPSLLPGSTALPIRWYKEWSWPGSSDWRRDWLAMLNPSAQGFQSFASTSARAGVSTSRSAARRSSSCLPAARSARKRETSSAPRHWRLDWIDQNEWKRPSDEQSDQSGRSTRVRRSAIP